MILTFLDMTAQHLQPGMAQPAECPSRFGVIGMIICVSDVGLGLGLGLGARARGG